jgi:hypothetical protein
MKYLRQEFMKEDGMFCEIVSIVCSPENIHNFPSLERGMIISF